MTVGSGLRVASSRTRPHDEAKGSPEWEHGPLVGRGRIRAKLTRGRKLTWVSKGPRKDIVTAGFDEPGDDDDMQGPLQQDMSHLLEDMAILGSDIEEEDT